ncbi:MAG: trypsin-like serine protease [Polyangiaceae bacterium]|nr:trypsin-like serine protease [Polyangiaceae bacterium]
MEKRFLRTFTDADLAEPALPPYDFRGTEQGEKFKKVVKPPRPPAGKVSLIHTDGVNQVDQEWLVDEADLGALGLVAEEIGMNNASEGGAPTGISSDSHVAALSGGVDNRVWKPIGSIYPYNHRELSRMGTLDNDQCSATLVGRRVVLTAAHCVVGAGGGYVKQYTPRRNGTGSTLSNAPYGSPWGIDVIYSSQYIYEDCPAHYNSNLSVCRQLDWAIMLLDSNPWTTSNGTPGWMGYWVPGTYILSNDVLYNDGYPVCSGYPNPPSFCLTNFAYGMTTGSRAGAFISYSGSQPLDFTLGVDWSAGHSGGPVWTDYPGSNGPYVVGIAATESNSTGPYPNAARSMNSYLANIISWVRATYP